MKKEYDREKAVQLIPLLRSITREIEERTKAIEASTSMPLSARPGKGQGAHDTFSSQAELATHRRELRLVKQELARLGCTLDPDHPLRVLIPGAHGAIGSGYTWSVSDAEPQPISVLATR